MYKIATSILPEAYYQKTLTEEKEKVKQFSCIAPTIELLSNKETLLQVLGSHDWEVDRTEPSGQDGILSKIHCANCGLDRIFIVSNIEQSAKRASEYRERKVKDR